MSPIQSGAKSILIVEDSPVIRAMLAHIIQNEGYAVTCVHNGLEALDYLRANPAPRLILLDLMMPLMNASEFMREHQDDFELARIPVVIISAYTDDPQRPATTGARGYLEKPIDLTVLLDTVRQYCGDATEVGDDYERA